MAVPLALWWRGDEGVMGEVIVCVREREREREFETDGQTDGKKEKEKKRRK